jgi:hypothetical protein
LANTTPVILPFHLRTLPHAGSEVTLEVESPATQRSVLDAGITRKARPALRCATLTAILS